MVKRTHISFILIFVASLTGCISEQPIAAELSVTQADIDKISDKCGLDRKFLVLEGASSVAFQPNIEAIENANTNYKVIDCTLNELRKFPDLKLGFVGNEVYQTDKNGDPIIEGDEGY